jgi:hypothetical protein
MASQETNPMGLSPANVLGELKRASSDADRRRWNEYLSLFDELGLRDGISRTSREPLEIEFPLSMTGLVTSGSTKSVYYSSVEPAPLVATLDKVGEVRANCRCNAAFRMIDGNWYIMLVF